MRSFGYSTARRIMVSADHFGYELRRQLNEAAAKSASELLITSHDLSRSVRLGKAWLNACCEAMEQEFREGDIVVQDRSGHGMAVRYRLPRGN
jgi:hypothetical protein